MHVIPSCLGIFLFAALARLAAGIARPDSSEPSLLRRGEEEEVEIGPQRPWSSTSARPPDPLTLAGPVPTRPDFSEPSLLRREEEVEIGPQRASLDLGGTDSLRRLLFAAFLSEAASALGHDHHQAHHHPASDDIKVWPLPSKVHSGHTVLHVKPSDGFISLDGEGGKGDESKTLQSAASRYHALMFRHHSETLETPGGEPVLSGLRISVKDPKDHLPSLDMDESYTLSIDHGSNDTAELKANTVIGALRGLETFSQLVRFDPASHSYLIHGTPLHIEDKPRFKHRGLMIDTARHFIPVAEILEIIDSLTYAKLNVLHWHIADEQSFPLEMTSFPDLWNGSFSEMERYTQDDARDIVAYAAERGIRVMPEFDMPGHAQSWCEGYPEVCPSSSCKTPLNVASNVTWSVVEGILKDITGGRRFDSSNPAGLFPDEFMHLGGDEVNTKCWEETSSIKAWLKEKGFSAKDAYGYFANRASQLASSMGRRPVQWSEVFDTFKGDLNKHTVVHVWKPGTSVEELTSLGFDVIRNVGYVPQSWYLDNLNVEWQAVYSNEPCEGIPENREDLCKKILGGQGEMWSEHIDGANLEAVVWPRLAAIAERLWSEREHTKDPDNAADRLEHFRELLLERGVHASRLDRQGGQAPDGPGSSAGGDHSDGWNALES